MRDNSIPYQLAAPAGTVTFDPSTNMYVELCDFGSDLVSSISKRPQQHGGYIDPAYLANGVWSAQVRMYGINSQITTNRQALMKALNSMYGDAGTATLTWTDATAGALRLVCYAIQRPAIALDGQGGLGVHANSWLCHLLLGSEKPYAEDANSTTVDSISLSSGGGGVTFPVTLPVTFTASSGGTATVYNYGDFAAMPILRAIGPLTNPVVRNLTTNKQLAFVGSIGGGDYWEIDLFNRTVKLNGVSTINALDISNSQWFSLGLGSTQLQLSGTGYTSSTLLRTFMRSAWG